MTTAYHVAPTAASARIASEGIIASGPNPRWSKYGVAVQPAGVYLWSRLRRALEYARDFYLLLEDECGLCDVWAVSINGLGVLPDPLPGLARQGAVYVPHSIAPERVSAVAQMVTA